MRIAIDLMGGDNAPAAVAEGCALALQKLSEDTELVIFGEESAAKALIEEYELDMFDVRFVATTQQIGCDESPTLAIRKKKDSSLVRAVESVASGETDCVISAGSTGALLAGATWANCTNVVVSGSGKLTLDAAVAAKGAFSREATVSVSDDGTIAIPAGETVVVRYLYRDGEPTFHGRYSEDFVTGGGTLRVRKSSRKAGFRLLVK